MMENMDCVFPKEGKSVLYNPAAIARRKRMEIRRFKKLSYSIELPARDMGPVQICHNLKRARPSCDELCDYPENSEARDSRSQKVQKEEDNGSETERDGFLANTEQSGCSHVKLQEDEGSASIYLKGKGIVECVEQSGYSAPKLLKDYGAGLSSLNATCTTACKTGFSDIGETSEQLTHKIPDSDLQNSCSLGMESSLSSPDMPGNLWFLSNKNVELSASPGGTSSFVPSMICTYHGFSHQGCPPSGKLLLCGAKREMEDRVTILPSFTQLTGGAEGISLCKREIEGKSVGFLHFYAVYDGHGSSQAPQCCMERLHLILAEELAKFLDVKNAIKDCYWKNVMASCFLRMDKELGGFCSNKHLNDVGSSSICSSKRVECERVGTAAVVAVVSSSQVVLASCGDSKAVLCHGSNAITLSLDRKHMEEKSDHTKASYERVLLSDGKGVGCLPPSAEAFGDRYLKHFAETEPVVTCIQRSGEDECLILASNGLWDVINEDTVCEITRKCLISSRKIRESGTFEPSEDPASVAAAAMLVKVAFARGSKDNISVVVVDLKS